MAIEAGEVEISWGRSEHGGGASVGIVIITSNNGAAAGEHLAGRADVIAHVKIRGRAHVLALSVVPLRDGIGRIAELQFLLTMPDELAR